MKRCGYVAIVGRPNVGKSTLFNRLVRQRISSVSFKPQTTRHRITGVRTDCESQFIFVDTPGLHQGQSRLINQTLNKTALTTLSDVDLLFWMIDCQQWTREDEMILEHVRVVNVPVILLLNKIDLVSNRQKLLPLLSERSVYYDFAELIPLSAQDGTNIDRLIIQSKRYLPESEFLFPGDIVTDRDELFFVAESVRESIFTYISSEVPYSCHVTVESFEDLESIIKAGAVIWVETSGQKKIIVGNKGEMIKKIGMRSRRQLEQLFQVPVHLQTWVKIKKGWQDDPSIVQRYE